MNGRRRLSIKNLLLVWVWMGLAVSGCARATPEPLTPDEILERAITRTAGLSGFAFSMEREGTPAYLDPLHILSLNRIEGVFVAPDQVQATVRVSTPGMVTEFHIISLGEEQWITNLITGAWEVLPLEWGFNPATLFEPETGMVSVLRSDLSNLELLDMAEIPELPGTELYRLSGDLDGGNLYYVSYGLISSAGMQAQILVDPESFEIHRIVLTEPLPEEEEDRIWTVDFWDFDQVIEITPPDLAANT
jgi:hypothetical protein